MYCQGRIVPTGTDPLSDQYRTEDKGNESANRVYELDSIPAGYVIVLGRDRTRKLNKSNPAIEHGYNVFTGLVVEIAREYSQGYRPLLLPQHAISKLNEVDCQFDYYSNMDEVKARA